MNKSQFWGFEVMHIMAAFFSLAGSNVFLNLFNLPLIFSWGVGLSVLIMLRVVSHGQKNGHLELLLKSFASPKLYLGHKMRGAP